MVAGGTSNTIESGVNSLILGGEASKITTGRNNFIIGGSGNSMCGTGLCTSISSMIGGKCNKISGRVLHSHMIGGSCNGIIASGANNCQSIILGGYYNCLCEVGYHGSIFNSMYSCVISGGIVGISNSYFGKIYNSNNASIHDSSSSCISGSTYSSIINGQNHLIKGFNQTVILGGCGQIADKHNTVFVNNFNISNSDFLIPAPDATSTTNLWINSFFSGDGSNCFYVGSRPLSSFVDCATYEGNLNYRRLDRISASGNLSYTGNMVIRCESLLPESSALISQSFVTGSTYIIKGAINGMFISGTTGCSSRFYREFTEIYRATGTTPSSGICYLREHLCNGINYAQDATNFGTGKAGLEMISGRPFLVARQRVGVGTGVNTCTSFAYDLCVYCHIVDY